jgi:mycothiol synthase
MTTPHEAAIAAIAVPETPDVPGLRFRHYLGAADHAGMATANQAVRDAMGALDFVSEESIARQYANLVNSDLHDDLLIAEVDGRIIGYGRVEWVDAIDGPRYLQTVCLLEPAYRRRGIGGAMLAWQEQRMGELAVSLPQDRESVMRTWTYDRDAGAAPLLGGRGWSVVGRGYEMRRPTLEAIPEVPLPEGFTLRPVDGAEARRVWEGAAEAFRDERGEGEWTDADWIRMSEDPYRDLALWAIAYHGDDVAGGVQGRIDPEENAHYGVQQGYVDAVWTRRPYRRRGLARALLADVLVRLRDRGMTSAHLGVDGLNPNQAVSLYESLGFDVHTSESEWTKPVSASEQPKEPTT